MNNIQLSEHFNLIEFECPCCHLVKLDEKVLYQLEIMRGIAGKPIHVNSAYRCYNHNLSVGGVGNSQHLVGRAADITIPCVAVKEVMQYAQHVGFTRVYKDARRNFVHCGL